MRDKKPSSSRERTLLRNADRVPVLPALVVTAFLLRLPFLGSTSLWLDEMCSLAIARLPWRPMLWVVAYQDSNASLYYVLLHMWLRLGSSEINMRILSVLLGVATLPVLYRLGNRLLGEPVGLIACLFLTVNKLHASQSQDARTYSLVVLLITISSLYFVRSIEQPGVKNWCGYILASVLAVYAHVFALPALLAHWLSIVFLRRREVPWKGLLASTGLITALTLPLIVSLAMKTDNPGAPPDWVLRLSVGVVGRLFWALAGGSHFGYTTALVAGIALSLGYFGLCALSMVQCVRLWRKIGPSLDTWRLGLVLFGFVLPIVLAILVSVRKPMLVDKYLMVCLPALMIAVAEGAVLLRPRWSAAAIAAIAGLAFFALLPYWQSRHQDREWQQATGSILSQAGPGDAIIFMVAPGRLLFDYYRAENRAAVLTPDVLYPQFADEFTDPESLRYLPPLDARVLADAPLHYRRVWLVLYHDQFGTTLPLRRQLQSLLDANYQQVQQCVFDGAPNFEQVEVVLYANDSSLPSPGGFSRQAVASTACPAQESQPGGRAGTL
jgi:4-amino-4-deoxy-L-arabinose transferase-like glycosyltransferase